MIKINKKRLGGAAVLAVVLFAVLFLNMELFVTEGQWQEQAVSLAVLLIVLGTLALSVEFVLPRFWNNLLVVSSFVALPMVMVAIIEGLAGHNVGMTPTVFWLNMIWCQVIYLLVFMLTQNSRWTIAIGTAVLYILGVVNHFVLSFRGTPLFPWDFLAVHTAGEVAGNYALALSLPLLLTGLLAFCCVAVAQIAAFRRPWGLMSLVYRGLLAALILFIGTGFYQRETWEHYRLNLDMWDQVSTSQNYGTALSLAMNGKYLILTSPDNYSLEIVGDILAERLPLLRMAYGSEETTEQPHIIVIMNEAFADMGVVGSFETTSPAMVYWDSLAEGVIKGNMYVSTLGGGTCNTEFEFLTGNSMAFLPAGSMAYQQYIHTPQSSLATVTAEQGYTPVAMHPADKANWNRNKVYPLLGFEEFIGIEDFQSPEYMRDAYVSDRCDYAKLIERFEAREPDEKLFMFNVTIQNHGGYQLAAEDLTEWILVKDGQYHQAAQYFSLLRQSDIAFEELLDYFQAQEEPVLVVMFGDHQPTLDKAFTEMLLGKPLSALTAKERQKLYQVPFVIWSNYGLETQYVPAISANYLGNLVLDTAGLEMTGYRSYLERLRKAVPMVNTLGYITADGRLHDWQETTTAKERLKEYELLQYNNLLDIKGRLPQLGELQPPE